MCSNFTVIINTLSFYISSASGQKSSSDWCFDGLYLALHTSLSAQHDPMCALKYVIPETDWQNNSLLRLLFIIWGGLLLGRLLLGCDSHESLKLLYAYPRVCDIIYVRIRMHKIIHTTCDSCMHSTVWYLRTGIIIINHIYA